MLDRAGAGPDRPLRRPRRRARGPRRTRRTRRPPRPRRAARPRSSSGAPGTPPRVSTAPVPMHLMRSAPPISRRRTRSRTSSTDRTTPNRRSSGSLMSRARPTTSPPPHGAVMKAPAHCIRGPRTSPASIASRSAQSVNARNEPTSRTVVKPASMVWRACRTPIRTSCAADVVVDGTPAVWTSPMRCVCMSIRPGRTVYRDRSMIVASSGMPSPAEATALTRPSTPTCRTRSPEVSPVSTSSSRPHRMATGRSEACSVTPASDRPTGRTAAPAAAAPVGDDR